MKRKRCVPEGWTEKELKELADHYDNQPEDEAIAEMENTQKLVPIESLLFKRAQKLAQEKKTTVEKIINALLKKSILKAA